MCLTLWGHYIDAVDSLPSGIKNSQEASAETIENNVRRLIIDETPTNPKYYEKMSLLLDEIIALRKEQVTDYREYLRKIVELTKKVKDPSQSADYPRTINSGAKRALYDNLEQDESLVLAIDSDIRHSKPDGWRGSKIKERKVKYTIAKHIEDDEKIEEIFEIVKNQGEY